MRAPSGRSFPLSREIRALGRTVRTPALYAVPLCALLLVGLAYQVRVPVRIDVGGPTDLVYWRAINGGEQDATHAPFRWTQAASTLTLPGLGPGGYRVRLDLTGARPPGFPAPHLVVLAGGQTLADLQPGPGRQGYDVAVPIGAVADGTLRLTLQTLDPFAPPGDKRELGVALYGVTILPAAAGWAPPPGRITGLLVLAAALAALLLGIAGWRPPVVLGGGLAWALAEVGFLLFDRLWLTLFPEVLVGVLLAAAGLLLVLGPLWRGLYRAGGAAWPELDQRWLLAIFAAAFVARLAGQLHPQIAIIDLIFHAHRFEQVQSGDLLFTIKSDEWGGRPTFYLPTPYLFMLPLQWLLNDELLTIRAFGVALDTLGVFLVYYLARRACADGRAGLLAAGLQVTFPLATLPFSWGITANLFGQFTSLAALVLAVGCYPRLTRPGPWLLLTGVLTAALLSHPGSVQLAGMTLGGILLVWAPGALVSRRSGPAGAGGRGAWLAMLAALLVATGIAWFGYYSHFAAAQLQQLAAILQERAARQAAAGFAIKVGGEVNDYSLGLRQQIVHDRGTWLVEGSRGLGAETWAYFHTWPLLWAGLGLFAARRGAAPARRRLLRAAAVWTAVVGLYALVGWAANLYVRYWLFLLPLVALGGGLLLSALTRRGRPGRLLVTAIMAVVTLDALAFWYMRLTFANK